MRDAKYKLRCEIRWCVGLCLVALSSGCNSRTPSTPPPPPVTQTSPPNVPPAAAPPVVQAPQVAPRNEPRQRYLSPAERALADADPRDVFEVEGTGQEFTVAAFEEVAAVDRFEIPADALADSTSLILGARVIEESPQAPAVLPGNQGARGSAVKLPEGFRVDPDAGATTTGWPLRIVCERTSNAMALVPAGAAHIGSANGPSETRPAFDSFLDAFYIDVTEVTLEQYGKYRDDVKEKAKDKKTGRVTPPTNDGGDPMEPALGLNWGNAQAFARWAGKELPTEAEWEKAARSSEGFRTPWGDGRAVWARTRTPEQIDRVGSFLTDQSVYGVFDLAGNAREWCADFYSDTAHQEAKAAAERTVRNWSGPKKASVSGQRVVKGNAPDWSAWNREGRSAAEKHGDVGFRCVLRLREGTDGT